MRLTLATALEPAPESHHSPGNRADAPAEEPRLSHRLACAFITLRITYQRGNNGYERQ